MVRVHGLGVAHSDGQLRVRAVPGVRLHGQVLAHLHGDSAVTPVWLFLLCFAELPVLVSLSLVEHHCQPKCLWIQLDSCVQRQGHSRGSKFQ